MHNSSAFCIETNLYSNQVPKIWGTLPINPSSSLIPRHLLFWFPQLQFGLASGNPHKWPWYLHSHKACGIQMMVAGPPCQHGVSLLCPQLSRDTHTNLFIHSPAHSQGSLFLYINLWGAFLYMAFCRLALLFPRDTSFKWDHRMMVILLIQ